MTTPRLSDEEIAGLERMGEAHPTDWLFPPIRRATVRALLSEVRASRASSPAKGEGVNCPDCGRERTVYRHCGSSRHIASAPPPAPAEATQPPEREADEAMVKAVESETSAALRYWQQGTHDVLDRPARASLLARLDDLRRDRDEAAAALGMSQEAMEVCVDCENAMRDRAEAAERESSEIRRHYETHLKGCGSRRGEPCRAPGPPCLACATEQRDALRDRVEALELAMHAASLIKCPACPGNDSNGHADRCWWGVVLRGSPGPEYDGARAALSSSPARASGAEDAAYPADDWCESPKCRGGCGCTQTGICACPHSEEDRSHEP